MLDNQCGKSAGLEKPWRRFDLFFENGRYNRKIGNYFGSPCGNRICSGLIPIPTKRAGILRKTLQQSQK